MTMLEVGFEATTTNAIAERAGVSIGSLYQFFPNKAAILHELNLRCLEELRVILDAAFTQDAYSLPVETFIERIMTTLDAFQRRHLSLFSLLNTMTPLMETMSVEEAFSHEIAGRIEGLLAHHYPNLEPYRRGVIARVCYRVCDHLLHFSTRGDARFRQAVTQEIQMILMAYTRTLDTQ